MKKKLLLWQNPNVIVKLVESLNHDKVSVISTDTVFGLIANITQKSFYSLNEVKKRSEKSYIVLINSLEKLQFFTDIDFNNKKLVNLLNNCWPGPVTIIFKCKANIPDYLKSFQNTIAIRIPKHPGLLQLLTYFEGLFSTSANLSGEKVPEELGELNFQIENYVDYIVINEFSNNHRYPIIPSTIIDCTGEQIKVIRSGVYPVEQLEKFYGEEFIK